MKRQKASLALVPILAVLGLATIAAADPAAVLVPGPLPALQAAGPAADNLPTWLRYPAISPDGAAIAFVYKGDIYRVPADGGAAVPLTLHEAHDTNPVWSRDGKSIAFASDRYGNFDVFIMPAAGGEARRLTYHSASEIPYSFTPGDQAVLFGAARLDAADNRTFPAGSQPELYKVPAAGGRAVQILGTPAEDAKLSRDGRLLLYHDKKGGENEWRKHHVSAIARDIWAYDTQTGQHRRITGFAGEDRSPVFTSDEKGFYYLSEESGTFNVHRLAAEGGASTQITKFAKNPVRFLSRADDGTLCFGYDGAVYTQRGDTAAPVRVPILIASDARANNEIVVPAGGEVREFAVSPGGKEIAVVSRGGIFAAGVDGGLTKRVTSSFGDETAVSFSPDGNAIVYASERDGHWGVYETRRARTEEPYFYASTLLKETPLVVNARQNTQPAYSPDGKKLAFVEDRATLKVLDLATKQALTLLTDRQLAPSAGGSQYYQWSPDGQWILFDYSVPGFAPAEIGLVKADGSGKIVNLTESGFEDRQAKWILGGQGMLWFSNRDGLKSVAQSGAAQYDAYALFFTREAWDRFRLTKEEAALLKDIEEKKTKPEAPKDKAAADKEKKDEVKPLVIDWTDLALRKSRLTLHSSSLGDALVNKDGDTLYYLARFEKGLNLWTTNLKTRETRMLAGLDANGGRLVWDKDQKSIFLLADGAVAKVDPASGKREPVRIKGEMTVDAAAERRAQFEHVWRQVLETFYTAGYHGADWDSLKPVYEKHLSGISDGYDMAELLSEMLGELNVSHSGARYGRQMENADETASLGAFYDPAYAGPGVKVVEVMAGGPLDKAGFDIAPGTVIEAVDGETIAPDKDIERYLNRRAGQNVLLTLTAPAAPAAAKGAVKSAAPLRREITVKPISPREESNLLYRRWVLRNQAEVEKLGGGRLGYIHVPGMSDSAYRSAFEEVMGKFANKEALVVDTRFNGGGDLVADLAMFLSGKKFFDYTSDKRSTGYEPNFRWTKPSISIVGEAQYSDGHCYAFAYQYLKLGKLVGMPVPGTCSFAGWEMLGASGVRWGVVPMGVKVEGIGYLDNHQTEPDVKVMNTFERVAKGRDEQLEAAVTELLKEIK
ncbi:MAG TPA: S41 family peptidase [Candidatus Aminicenantes bacterium]|nr:S41 family peptidase [Candidatus Aminicenantes bacterium]HRY65559.1 S41 family peptidase [Candidatus Aminicenantes bacterium]HRZ72553.1 S41 family peptidase [Candidatus Aminicenantes bacterium]